MAHLPYSKDFEDPGRPNWRELRALGYKMPVLYRRGPVCSHPVNRLSGPTGANINLLPPRKSRTSILWSILHDHTSMGPSYQSLLQHYISNDDPDLVAKEALERQEAKFPKFMSLPLEIREMIWRFAIPRRTFFFEAATHFAFPDSHGMKNITLPVPMIAKSCRETRRVVMKLCPSILLTQLAADDRSRYRNECRPGGFFIRDIDLVLFNFECYFHDNDVNTCPPLRWSNDVMLADTRKDEVGVIWANFEYVLYLSRTPQDELPAKLIPWEWLIKAGGQRGKGGIERLYVQFSPVDVIIPLYVRSGYNQLSCHSRRFLRREEVRFVVDLDDDDMLADLEILNNVDPGEYFPRRWTKPECGRQDFLRESRDCRNCELRKNDPEMANLDGNTPRYAGCFLWPNKGLCIYCLRELWKHRERARMLGFWLYLHWMADFGTSKDMYDQAAAANPEGPQAKHPYLPYWCVFPKDRDALRITSQAKEIPWVQEKLAEAPEVRAIVSVRLSLEVEGRTRPHRDQRTYRYPIPREWA